MGRARDATTRPSSLGSDGSSMAMSADQTEGTRMQRRAKAAMRKATSMTSITRGEGNGKDRDLMDGKWSEERRTEKGKNSTCHFAGPRHNCTQLLPCIT